MGDASGPLGMFDSGVGGLAVLAEMRRVLPREDVVYYADSAFFPYGSRSVAEIRDRCEAVTRELLGLGAKLIVVACNTATSAAIAHLRRSFDVPFVGMEPALKPAAEQTVAGKVALLVTPHTARGERLAALVDRYGAEVTVQTLPAADLAERVERGAIDDIETRELVRRYLEPLRTSGADVLALGCTHYAFLRSMISEEAGAGVTVIEPSEAVARQVQRVLAGARLLKSAGAGSVRYLTSGEAQAFEDVRRRLREAGADIPEAEPISAE